MNNLFDHPLFIWITAFLSDPILNFTSQFEEQILGERTKVTICTLSL